MHRSNDRISLWHVPFHNLEWPSLAASTSDSRNDEHLKKQKHWQIVQEFGVNLIRITQIKVSLVFLNQQWTREILLVALNNIAKVFFSWIDNFYCELFIVSTMIRPWETFKNINKARSFDFSCTKWGMEMGSEGI